MKIKRAEFIEKWLEALESGEYKQGRNVLVSIDDGGKERFCCLGVACAVYGMDISVLDDDCQETLPNNVARKLGIDTLGEFIEPITHIGERHYSLAKLNDSGVRFKTIARIIREQLKKKNFEKPYHSN